MCAWGHKQIVDGNFVCVECGESEPLEESGEDHLIFHPEEDDYISGQSKWFTNRDGKLMYNVISMRTTHAQRVDGRGVSDNWWISIGITGTKGKDEQCLTLAIQADVHSIRLNEKEEAALRYIFNVRHEAREEERRRYAEVVEDE
jgi:hypothetical protein